MTSALRTAVIVHGMPLRHMYFDPATPSPSNYNWIPWLQKALAMNDVLAQTPEMPRPFEPAFDDWSALFERVEIGPDTSLIGHSGGGGFLVRWLSARPAVRVRKVILVAPWLDPRRERTGSFFDFTIDPGLAARCGEVVIFHSDNDDPTIHESVRRLRAALPTASYREFHLGHFSHYDMPSPEFPELLEEILR